VALSRKALTQGAKLWIDGELVTLVTAVEHDERGTWCIIELPDHSMHRRYLTHAELAVGLVPANDGRGGSDGALASLWGRWMGWAIPRIRSAVLATRPLRPYPHQDRAVFRSMLPQPRLRFLLADEPGTGKTIMTGMYLAEGHRRGLVPGKTLIAVPAHLVSKWERDLRRLFGIEAKRITAEVGRELEELRADVDVWLVSLDLLTRNPDVRRKVAGREASWSLAVFDEAHRLTPTSQYLDAAREVTDVSHHVVLLTATPHRGNEHYFRALLHLLEPVWYPWSPNLADYGPGRFRPSELHFLRRMKEDLRGYDGEPLFKPRFAKVRPIRLSVAEQEAYDAVMAYVDAWYPDRSTLVRSIYGKRAASSVKAAVETLRRRREILAHPLAVRVDPVPPRGFDDPTLTDAALEDDEAWASAEQAVVEARSRDRRQELEAVDRVLAQLEAALGSRQPPAKWLETEMLLGQHGILPGSGQLLVFSEFADTARWLAALFAAAGYTTQVLEGETAAEQRDHLQAAFLAGRFQVLVSTDAGGEGIDLQSANVMINWDIPWSLVRLEQRMGRLHRIGQTRPVHVYHLVARSTREGRVQERVLENLTQAASALSGRIYDLLDATAERAGLRLGRLMAAAQASDAAAVRAAAEVPEADALVHAAQELQAQDNRLRSRVDMGEARRWLAEDRLEAINPVIVEGFVRHLAGAEGWAVRYGPAEGLLLLDMPVRLSEALRLGRQQRVQVATSGRAVLDASEAGVDITGVTALGPSEPAFAALVGRALSAWEGELRKGAPAEDPSSLSDYLLAACGAQVQLHDGTRTVQLPLTTLIRVSGGESFSVPWEALLRLRSTAGQTAVPPPGVLRQAEEGGQVAVVCERDRLRAERAAWAEQARADLAAIEARWQGQVRAYPAAQRTELHSEFERHKRARLAQIEQSSRVQVTPARLLGWLAVRGTATPATRGSDPDSERVAIGVVWAELEARGLAVDDRQAAGLGYDLLAHDRTTGEQRLIEAKGQTATLSPVTMEQHEWAQARQRGVDYWLYVVTDCATRPQITVRVQDPAGVFGGPRLIQRVQIPLAELRKVAS